jgi:hypothetical protein
MDYRASMIPPRPQAGRWEQLLEVLNGLSASQAPQMPTMGGAMGALKSYGASLPQSPEDMIGNPNPNLPMPQQVDPRQPWGGIGLAGDYDSGWLEKSLADRQAHYGQQPKATPGPSLEKANPVLMGTETAGIGDIPVGNRMTPGRRWNEGLASDPLGATRMSQPTVGGAVPPDAHDLRQQADLSKYQGELATLDAMSSRAKPIVESLSTPGASTVDGPVVPSRQKQLMAQLDAMPNAPDSTREAMLFAALNTGAEDRASGQGAKPYQSVRKYAPGRQEELAARQQAVRDRGQRRGQAREARMGGGDELAVQRYMDVLNQMNGGSVGGGPAAAGPGGASPPDPAMLTAMFGPQVAQMYLQRADVVADNNRGMAAIKVQEEQNRLQGEQSALHANKFAVESLPIHMRNLPGYVLSAQNKGVVEDGSVLPYVQEIKSRGIETKDAIANELKRLGFLSAEQNDRVIQQVLGATQVQAPGPAGPQFDWFDSMSSALSGGGNQNPSGFQFRGGF